MPSVAAAPRDPATFPRLFKRAASIIVPFLIQQRLWERGSVCTNGHLSREPRLDRFKNATLTHRLILLLHATSAPISICSGADTPSSHGFAERGPDDVRKERRAASFPPHSGAAIRRSTKEETK